MRKNKNAELRKPEILESYYQVLIDEGLEGASITKIAKRLGIHPSLIIHYFKDKENMKLAVIELMIQKYESPHLINFDHIADPRARFDALMDTLFSKNWSRTVDPGVHFGFYYMSFRNEKIQERFKIMFKRLRDFLRDQFTYFNRQGFISVTDVDEAADYIITLMEGMEFHAQFLAEGQAFDKFAQTAKKTALIALKSGEL